MNGSLREFNKSNLQDTSKVRVEMEEGRIVLYPTEKRTSD